MSFRPFQPFRAFGGGAAPALWWLAGGVSAADCAGCYQPKGAASLADSYANKNNPGTHNAFTGTAPTWAAVSGWTYNGSSQYLKTDIVPATGAWSMIVRVANAATNVTRNPVAGCVNVTGGIKRFYIDACVSAVNKTEYGMGSAMDNDGFFQIAPQTSAGVLAIAGAKAYRNGIPESPASSSNVGSSLPIYLGAGNLDGTPFAYFKGTIIAVSIYSRTLTAAEVLAISTAMAAI